MIRLGSLGGCGQCSWPGLRALPSTCSAHAASSQGGRCNRWGGRRMLHLHTFSTLRPSRKSKEQQAPYSHVISPLPLPWGQGSACKQAHVGSPPPLPPAALPEALLAPPRAPTLPKILPAHHAPLCIPGPWVPLAADCVFLTRSRPAKFARGERKGGESSDRVDWAAFQPQPAKREKWGRRTRMRLGEGGGGPCSTWVGPPA